MTRMTGPDCVVMCNLINTYQCEWHRMTRMTGPDCVVMCNLINKYIHTYIHTYIHKYIHTYIYRRYFQHAHVIPIVGVGKRGEI